MTDDINIKPLISRDSNTTGKMILDCVNVPLSYNTLNNWLNPDYAIQNNELDLLIATLAIQQQNGIFEYKLEGKQLTFTVWLPLAKDADVA